MAWICGLNRPDSAFEGLTKVIVDGIFRGAGHR